MILGHGDKGAIIREPHNHTGCCGHGHSHCCNNNQYVVVNGKLVYYKFAADGRVNVASLHAFSQEERSQFVKNYHYKDESPKITGYVKSVLFVFTIFLIVSSIGSFIGIGSGLELLLNELSLIVIIWPYVLKLTTSSKLSLVAMAAAVSILIISPFSIAFNTMLALIVMAQSFHYLINDGDVNYGDVLAVGAWQLMVCMCANYIALPFILLAPISAIYGIINVNNPHLNCSFALVMVVLISMGAALLSALLGLGHVVCLHDAVIAAMIVFMKDIAMHTAQNDFPFVAFAHSQKLTTDISLLDASDNVVISLDQCTTESLVGRGVLTMGIEEGSLHEKKYPLSAFGNIIPKGAIVENGEILGIPMTKQENNISSEFDSLVMYMVPACFVLTFLASESVFLITGSATIALIVGLQTLLAACPCIFLIVPYMEYRVSSILASSLHDSHTHYMTPTVNFKNKIISALMWPIMALGTRWVWDRTRTTHFPQSNTTEASPYMFSQGAKDFISYIKDTCGTKLMYFISGSGEERNESYINDLASVGVSENIYVSAQYGQSCCNKLKGFNQYICSQQEKESDAFYVYFGDGDNDVKVMGIPQVFGVGIDPTPKVAGKTTLNIYSWEPYVGNASHLYKIISFVKSSQLFSTAMAIEALLLTLAAIFLPVATIVLYEQIMPMWVSCAVMTGGFLSLIMQAELFFVLSSINANFRISDCFCLTNIGVFCDKNKDNAGRLGGFMNYFEKDAEKGLTLVNYAV